jgi:arylsulfatase A-like enzyme
VYIRPVRRPVLQNVPTDNVDAEQIAKGSSRRGLGPAFEAPDLGDECYHDGTTAAHAIGELRRLSQLGKPFFMALGFLKPHLPFNAPKRYWDLYDPSKLPLAANPFAPRNATQYSLLDFGELRGFFQIPKSGPIPGSLARKLIHGYSACVSYSDAQMGRVLAELDRLGLHDDTVVIAWGDHGWKLGEHASWCKHSNFEIDARAPMVLRAPGRCPGARTKALVEFVDMYPTLCELCGLEIPAHCEGASMVPLLEAPNRLWKSAAFNQYPRANMTVMGYAMRTDRFRYVEWQSWPQRQVVARELYDHRVDSQENANVADVPQYAAIIQHLSRQMAAGWQAARPDRAGAPGLPACPR